MEGQVCSNSELRHGILDWTHMMFGTIKEGIIEISEECLGDSHAKIDSSELD